ncbi:MAG: 30S ribosomal protein S11, partial [Chloroflexi bacterium]|nr:30S ribosomal protein S11 [Chloroflexota bacterium]
MARANTRSRRRERKMVPKGKGFITATFNNTLVSLTDPEGNMLAWSSSGCLGFKGSRKGTAFA